MDPQEVKDIKRLSRIQNSYSQDLTSGKVSKNFQPVKIDLIQEYLSNRDLQDSDLSEKSEDFYEHPEKNSEIFTIPAKRPEPEEKKVDVEELKEKLKNLLKPFEKVSTAALRLRGPMVKPKIFKKNVRKQMKKEEKIENSKLSKDYEFFCEICSDLISSGMEDLYEFTREEL
jgi:Asp-tRNA(Asn)/Glu-tRNA(Gln) amidotransferase C subunit